MILRILNFYAQNSGLESLEIGLIM
jgi:hypothetical protein